MSGVLGSGNSRLLAAAALAGTLGLASAPANAAVVTFDSVGDTTTLSFNGLSGTPLALVPGLTADVTYTLTSIGGGGTIWDFSYSITNTSSAPTTASRVAGIGFNLDVGAPASGSAAGVLSSFDTSPPVVPNLGSRDVCVSGNNCAAGGGAGVTIGNSGGGTFQLVFGSAVLALNADDFFVRYQAIDSGAIRGGSGVGVVATVPEPATWAMMLIGFAGLGYAARRRATAAAQA